MLTIFQCVDRIDIPIREEERLGEAADEQPP